MSADRIIAQIPHYLPLLAVAVALVALQRSPLWRPLVRRLDAVANRRGLAIALVAAVAFLHYLGLALHHWPEPVYADEFSYLLMADTFADGRLTNPTPRLSYLLWAPDVIFEPTYQSKYPPAQGVLLALGERLGGDPLVGVWLSMAAACAAACWLMQRWLRPRWALFGGLMIATHKALATFWGATYFGGAAAMLGGALLYGALPRLFDERRARHAVTMGVGLALLANSRPFEGLVASLPAAALVVAWLIRERAWRSRELMGRVVVPLTAVVVLAAVSMGVYHRAVTGNPFKMPYQVFLETSDVANLALPGDSQGRAADEPPALIQRHFMFYTLGGDPHLWLPLLLLPLAIRRNRWMQLALVAIVLTFTAVWLTVLASAHYAAPITALLFALYFQCVRHLRVVLRRWRLAFQLFVAVFLTLWGVQLMDSPRYHASKFPPEHLHHYSLLRAELMRPLESDPDRHLVVVPWDNHTSRVLTWVKNPPDIDAAKVVWAWQGVGLAEHFGDRRYWLLDETVWPPVLVATTRSDLVWTLRCRDRGRATLHRKDEAATSLRIDIENPGDGPDAIELARLHPALDPADGYTLRFRGRADSERTIEIHVSRGDGRPIDDAALRHVVTLDPDWKDIEIHYSPSDPRDYVALELWLGGNTAGVDLEGIEVRVGQTTGSTDSPARIE